MEKITAYSFLYYAAVPTTGTASFTKLIDITSYPKLFATPEAIDISDMSSNYAKYTQGYIDVGGGLDFGFNYSKDAFDTVKTLEVDTNGEPITYIFQLRFGETGAYGAWEWRGTMFASPDAGELKAKRSGTLTVYPTTKPTAVTIS